MIKGRLKLIWSFSRPLCNVSFPTIFHCIDESYSLYNVNYVNTVLMVYHSKACTKQS